VQWVGSATAHSTPRLIYREERRSEEKLGEKKRREKK
jgi:hypothetical protein